MSLITKDYLSLGIKSLKNLINKLETRFLTEEEAIKLVAEVGFVEPVVASDGSIYTDEKGNVYSL